MIVTAAYAYGKLKILIMKKDVSILSATKDLFYSATETFGFE